MTTRDSALPNYLPIRRILVDGVVQRGIVDIDFDTDAVSAVVDRTAKKITIGLPSTPEQAFTPVLTIDRNAKQIATSNDDGNIIIGVSLLGHREGATKLIVILANELAAVENLILASDLNVAGDAFDPTVENHIYVSYNDGLFSSVLRALPSRDFAGPTIESVTVEAADTDALVVTFDKPVYLASLTGLSLSFSVGTARTITGILSGNGTAVVTLSLSGAMTSTDVADFVVAATNGVQALNGGALAAATEAVENNIELTFAGTLAFWRASSVVESGGNVATWTDLSGNGNHLTQATAGNRAAYSASDAAFDNQPIADFDGTDNFYANADLKLGGVDPTAGDEYTILAVVKFDATTGHCLFGAHVDSPGGDFTCLTLFAETNKMKFAAKASAGSTFTTFTTTTPIELMAIGSNTNRVVYVNQAALVDEATGWDDADTQAAPLGAVLGRLPQSGIYYFNGKLAELRVIRRTTGSFFSAEEKAAWAAYVLDRYGIG